MPNPHAFAGDPKDLLVLTSSEYESLMDENKVSVEASNKGILLLESTKTDLPQNCHTLCLRRYGAAYLCGKMAAECPQATIIAACPNDNILQPAIEGFQDGFAEISGQKANIEYLADDATGFNCTEQAYSIAKSLPYDAFIFPLAGGSNNGIYKYVRENLFTGLLVAGMDVDCSSYSTRTPFSLTLAIDKALYAFLEDWYAGMVTTQHVEYGMAEGMVNVTVNSSFYDNCITWEDYYDTPTYWQDAYNKYYQSALEAERKYYEK